mmetsp:Transcript_85434/g.226894  ORF Transcript_85434/g.226894 Transcript_85434/m.226894 type:complete len:510 (-) Transcript_85434:10-1539(-)
MQDVFFDTVTPQQAISSPRAQPPPMSQAFSEPMFAPAERGTPSGGARAALQAEPLPLPTSAPWIWQSAPPAGQMDAGPGTPASAHQPPATPPPQRGVYQAAPSALFSTGPLLSRQTLGEVPGPPPDTCRGKHREAAAPWGQVMCMGFVAAVFVVCLPMVGGFILLQDPDYMFWAGHRFPTQLIGAGSGSLLLLGAVLLALAGCAAKEAITVRLLSSLAVSFSSLVGLLLVLSSLSASSHLYSVSSKIDSLGCRSSMPELVKLMDFSVVLYNLRMTPACFTHESVQACSGWRLNEHTRYLKYLEEEFDCGPLCAEEPAPSLRPSISVGSSLLHVGRARSLRRRTAEPLDTSGGFATGEMAWLSGNETFVRKVFKAIPGFTWNEGMADMLGRSFRVVAPERAGLVGLPSPDGSQTGVWYFPAAALELAPLKVEEPQLPISHAASLKLFSHGSTSMTCLPIVSTRLRVLAYSFGDLLFWQGLLLLAAALLCALLGLCCISVRTGGRGAGRKA